MTIKEIVDYVLKTPGNTNPAVLTHMLQQLISEAGGGDLPPAGSNVTYDGGEEV